MAAVYSNTRLSFSRIPAWIVPAGLLAAILLAYLFWVHPYMMSWGATPAEVAMPLPGDNELPDYTVVSTRALTIHAPIEQVWPWLAQIGQGRAGYYSYDWLENLFAARMTNLDRIDPALRLRQVGDHVSMMENGPFAPVARIDPPSAIILKGGWCWYLQPLGADQTRLIVRYASFEIKDAFSALFYYPIFEPIHFVMEAGMMLGLKIRAENAANQPIGVRP